MIKKLLKMLIIVVTIATFTITCSASEETDEFLSEFEEILSGEDFDYSLDSDGAIMSLGVEALFSLLISAISGRGGELVSFFLLLVGVLLLMVLADAYSEKGAAVARGVGLVSSSVILFRVLALFSEVSLSLSKISQVFSSLSPLLVAITLAGGGTQTAAVSSVGATVISSLVGVLSGRLLSLLISLSLASASLSVLDGVGIGEVQRGVKSIFLSVTGILGAIIGASLSLQTLIAASADSAGMRAAKYAASSMIPLVGGNISASLSTLAAGLSYVKGVVGGVSVALIVSYFVLPLVLLLFYRLSLSSAASLAEVVGSKTAKRVFLSYRFSLDALIATYAVSSLLYILEIVLFMMSGVALS